MLNGFDHISGKATDMYIATYGYMINKYTMSFYILIVCDCFQYLLEGSKFVARHLMNNV